MSQSDHKSSKEYKVLNSFSLEDLSKQLKIGLWSAHLTTGEIHLSETLRDICDLKEEHGLDLDGFLKLLCPKHYPQLEKSLELLKTSGHPFQLDLKLPTKSGHQKWLDCRFTLGSDPNGHPKMLCGICMDVSATSNAMEHQRSQRSFLETVIENIPDMIFVKDAKELRFVRFNKAGYELLGMTAQDLIGKNDFDFFPDEQAKFFAEKDQAVLESKTLLDIPEEPIQTASGERILHTKKIPVLDHNGRAIYLLGISRDITEQKKLQEELEEKRKLLNQASKLSTLGEMAAGVAHEINNPLAVIDGKARSLLRKSEKASLDPQTAADALNKILSMTERITKIVGGLKTFSRETGEQQFNLTPINEVLDMTTGLVFERLRRGNCELRLPKGISESTKLECNAIQLSQVLVNLINNGFDAVQESDNAWVEVVLDEGPESFELRVIDSGEGISQENCERIFNPFFTTKDVGKGTGLGLSISKGIIDAHGGNFYYDQSAEHSTFVIVLPKLHSGLRAA